mgnify:CR=1 FL=1
MSGRKKNIYVLTFGNMHERDMSGFPPASTENVRKTTHRGA